MRTKIFTFIEGLMVPSLFVAIGLFVWHASTVWWNIPEFLLPAPHIIIEELLHRPQFYARHLLYTLATALAGYGISILIGVGLAALFTWSRTAERGLYPYVLALKVTPTVALAPILVLWLGIGTLSKIVTVVLICFFPIFIGALKGFRSCGRETLYLFRSLNASKWQTLRHLSIPNALPYIFPALKVSILFALTGALLGEFVASNEGIGYVILYGLKTFDSVLMFAAVVTLVFCGYALFWLVNYLERRYVFWQQHDEL